MADFDAPSFSLGLDCDLFDSEPQIAPVAHETDPSSSNQLSAFATFEDNNDEFETLVVDDSEPEYLDSHPKLKRLRRATSSSVPAKSTAEFNFTEVIDDEDTDVFSSPEDRYTDQHLHTSSSFPPNRPEDLTNQPVKRKQHLSNDLESVFTDFNSDYDDPSVSRKCNVSSLNSNVGKYDDLPQHVKRMQSLSNALGDFPKAYRYFFHDDPRIQELVRSRLPNFSPLGSMLNIDLEQPGTSKIDYMGQFSFGESSKQAARTVNNKKSSTTRKNSRNSETEEMSQGWVNPKLVVGEVAKKGAVKKKARSANRTAGHWLTGSDGKKVYVGKTGRELTGRTAYMQYKKESGLGFKRVKRSSVTKKTK